MRGQEETKMRIEECNDLLGILALLLWERGIRRLGDRRLSISLLI